MAGILILAVVMLMAVPSSGRAQTQWQKVPGAASDIAIADDGTVWIIGRVTEKAETSGDADEIGKKRKKAKKNKKKGSDTAIYRLDGETGRWIKAGEKGWRIAVAGQAPWVIDRKGRIARLNGQKWKQIRKSPRAVDIGASAKGVWVLAKPKVGRKDYTVYRWTGKAWSKVSGGGVRIAVDSDGNPWVANDKGELNAHIGGTWKRFMSPAAGDLAIRGHNAPLVVDRKGAIHIYKPTQKKWLDLKGRALYT